MIIPNWIMVIIYTLATIGLSHLIVKPLMDLIEFATFGFIFENQAIPEKLQDNRVFKFFRYLLNLLTGVRL